MNYLHLRYLVTVASLGSLTEASKELMVAQPNLSRIIREIEDSVGVPLFTRSSRGMHLTPEGKRFIQRARQILAELDDLEKMFDDSPEQQLFSVSVPSAAYITDAFARFSAAMDERPAEFICRANTTSETIRDVLEGNCHLGIIRYPYKEEAHFRALLEEKHLTYELLADFACFVLVSKQSPLAGCVSLSPQDLTPFAEIRCENACLPPFPCPEAPEEAPEMPRERRILVSDFATQIAVLQQNPQAYARTVPVSPDLLMGSHLVQIPFADSTDLCRDVLIYRSGYRLTELDKRFTTEMVLSKRKTRG